MNGAILPQFWMLRVDLALGSHMTPIVCYHRLQILRTLYSSWALKTLHWTAFHKYIKVSIHDLHASRLIIRSLPQAWLPRAALIHPPRSAKSGRLGTIWVPTSHPSNLQTLFQVISTIDIFSCVIIPRQRVILVSIFRDGFGNSRNRAKTGLAILHRLLLVFDAENGRLAANIHAHAIHRPRHWLRGYCIFRYGTVGGAYFFLNFKGRIRNERI